MLVKKKKITKAQLKVILGQHKKWLADETTGKRADLSRADLHGADLHGADLRGAKLTNADLSGANLTGADLSKANLCDANLCCANLHGADLHDTNLTTTNLTKADLSDADLSDANMSAYMFKTDLSGANLSRASLYKAYLCKVDLCSAVLYHADLRSADLSNTDLRGADLRGAKLSKARLSNADLAGANLSGALGLSTVKCDIYTAGFRLTPPETGEYVAWKSAGKNIIKLLIPATAKRSSATSRKCRASEAKVLGIYTMNGKPTKIAAVYSDHDKSFAYKVGETVSVPDFNPDRWVECTSGIHHFMSMAEAISWAE